MKIQNLLLVLFLFVFNLNHHSQSFNLLKNHDKIYKSSFLQLGSKSSEDSEIIEDIVNLDIDDVSELVQTELQSFSLKKNSSSVQAGEMQPVNGSLVEIWPWMYQHNRTNPYYFGIGECNKTSCKNGNCLTKSACLCDDGYAQVANDTNMCNYEMKNQATAFIMEFLFIFGFGNMYAGRWAHGWMKLIIFASVIILDIILRHCFKSQDYNTKRCFNWIFLGLYFGCLFWHTLDIVMFALNKYEDGNGFPLYIWGNPMTNI